MRGRLRHLAVLAAVAALAVGATGCSQLDHRTGPKTLDQAMSKSFKRAGAAAHRMTTNHAFRDVISYARFRCRPRGPEPKGNADWSWFCKVLWLRSDRPGHHLATYGVSVDQRGCFEAVSANFRPLLPERVLGGRLETNPLVYIRSCP
jgi:hypothetical protein